MERDRKTNVLEEIVLSALSFSRKIRYDYVSSFSGHAALFILMSLFPMMMYVVSLVSYLPFVPGDNFLYTYFGNLIPKNVIQLLEGLILEAKEGGTATLKSVALIGTLICASKGVYAIIIGLNAVYGIRETRNFFIIYGIAVVYVLALFVMMGLLMFLIVFGNVIYDFVITYMPILAKFESKFFILKFICLLLILVGFFLLIYLKIPNRKSKIRYELTGAIFSAAVLLLFSWIFSIYVDSYANYTITYGSLASMIVLILWIYGTMYITFIGAEINGVMKKSAEYKYDYRRTYDYYTNEYQGDLILEKDKHRIQQALDTINRFEKKKEQKK